ncbi:MAG: sigma-70 family RNA polymerase sigma factor [Armatimonadota bacterium]
MDSLTCALSKPEMGFTIERKMNGITDQVVVERVLNGDMDAFSILVNKYQDRIYSAVLNYVLNRDDAVDVTQEAFVKAYSKLKTFNSGSAFYTWLYRIAVNASIDFLRKRKSRQADSLDDDKYTETGFEPVSHDVSTDPEKVVVRGEQVHMLRKAIGLLSDKLRSALILHDVEGLSQEEVAAILKVPVGTVKSRVSRARAELKYLLGKQMGEML